MLNLMNERTIPGQKRQFYFMKDKLENTQWVFRSGKLKQNKLCNDQRKMTTTTKKHKYTKHNMKT
jgi:hypothetical protein